MADPTDRDAERLDAWLDGYRRNGDELTDFAGRILHDAALPSEPNGLTGEQRDRLRARLFGGDSDTEKARPTVQTTTFAPNGAIPAQVAIPIREPERSAPSKLSILMTAALVALIAIAGFGLLRDGINLPGGGDPAPTGLPALAFSPVASPAAETSCSRYQVVSVFDGDVPDLLKNTAHATLDDGTLTWHCNGASKTLATGVRSANGVFWPGVIAVVTENNEVRLLNVASRAALDIDGDFVLNDEKKIDFREGFIWSGGPEPWVIVPANAERTDWQIIDLRSMESLLLSDELGGPLPRPFTPSFGQVTGTDVAVIRWYESLPNLPSTPQAGGVNGVPPLGSAALVLPHSIENRRWIEVADWNALDSRMSYTQVFSVSQDGKLLAYASQDDGEPVARVEDAISGKRVADVPVDVLGQGTHFFLAGNGDRLVTSNGGTAVIHDLTSADVIAEQTFDTAVLAFNPTADPYTVLASIGTNWVVPIDVLDGTVGESWPYVPNIVVQLFGDYELPKNIVRVVTDPQMSGQSIIQLVNPTTDDVVLGSEPVEANPVQIVSFNTYLRDGGDLAVVPIGYNRAVVMDAASGETWQIAAPVDDDRLWHFFPSYDGDFVTAYPEPPQGTTGTAQTEYWIAPTQPGAEWMLLSGITADTSMAVPATPAG